MTTPAGWFPDPGKRHELRYWDGRNWTEHVSDQGNVGFDAIQPAAPGGAEDGRTASEPAAAATKETAPSVGPGVVEPGSLGESTHSEVRPSDRDAPGTTDKGEAVDLTRETVTTFNAKRVAKALQTECVDLRGRVSALSVERAEMKRILDDMGALDALERQRRLDEQFAERRGRLEEQEIAAGLLARKVAGLRLEVAELERQTIALRDRLDLEELGLFDFEHPAEQSARLAEELEQVRSQIRRMNKIGEAITATSGFTFNNSAAQGKKFVNQMSRIMLRSYNAEAENAVKTVRAGNVAAAKKRLKTAEQQIAKQGEMINLRVTHRYHGLRAREIELAASHLQAVAAAKEAEREHRAELREQRKLEAEIRREKERLDKERMHYLNSIRRLREAGDEAAAAALEVELGRVDDEIARADYRAANIRAGYVYVISNIGAFGEGVVKIGMTRRLEPMDRIRELGDASVPFPFDVHALFFSDDAVSIETMLHRTFSEERLNKVNQRREYFRVSPERVLEALEEHQVSVLEFSTHADAADFRMSWPSGYPRIH